MDRLPNEIWLSIFQYLHPIDILHAFNNLNQRFQQLIMRYPEKIDFSNLPYPYYKLFCDEILPQQGHSIYSLILKHELQLKIFKDIIYRLANLRSLTLILQVARRHFTRSISDTVGNSYLTQLYHFKHLTDLRLIGHFGLFNVFRIIHQNPSSSLTNLTLLTDDDSCFNEWFFASDNVSMPNIKVLTIHLKLFYHIFPLLNTMINVDKVNLSVSNLNRIPPLGVQWTRSMNKQTEVNENLSNQEYGSLADLRSLLTPEMRLEEEFFDKFVRTRSKCSLRFRLQYQEPSKRTTNFLAEHVFQWLKSFVDELKDYLQSFTLIMSTYDKELVQWESLQSLQITLTSQVPFQYLIHTPRQPSSHFAHVKKLSDQTYYIYTMNPRRPIPFDAVSWNNEFQCENPNLTPYQLRQTRLLLVSISEWDGLCLLHTDLWKNNWLDRLVNLHEISILCDENLQSMNDEMILNMKKFFSTLMTASPHLHKLCFNGSMTSSQQMIELFQEIFIQHLSKNTITHFYCKMRNPLRFHRAFLQELAEIFPNLHDLRLISFPFTSYIDQEYLSSISIIVQTQIFFRKIAHLNLQIDLDGVDQQDIKEFEEWLNEHQNQLFYADYTFNDDSLNVELWLYNVPSRTISGYRPNDC